MTCPKCKTNNGVTQYYGKTCKKCGFVLVEEKEDLEEKRKMTITEKELKEIADTIDPDRIFLQECEEICKCRFGECLEEKEE